MRRAVAGFVIALLAFIGVPAYAGGVVDEVRLGMMAHDIQALGGREPGPDVNAEILFTSPFPQGWGEDMPAWLRWVTRPRPNVGASINTAGATSQAYVGLTWSLMLASGVFSRDDGVTLGFSAGPSFNNGLANTTDPNRKSLGSNVLFRVGAEVGYQVTPSVGVYVSFDHSSNADIASRNEGLNDVGVRLGLKF
jgi:lipid A 3-O-deacylase